MEVLPLVVGSLGTNCYVVFDKGTSQAIIVDPGDDGGYILEKLSSLSLRPMAIVATHGHFDHILAATEIQETYSTPFFIHSRDVFLIGRMKETAEFFLKRPIIEPPPTVSGFLVPGGDISLGGARLHILDSPGHTPGSVCLYAQEDNMLFTGDLIFVHGAVGRTDFSYSDRSELEMSIVRVLSLPKETRLLPGHGEETTVGAERGYH